MVCGSSSLKTTLKMLTHQAQTRQSLPQEGPPTTQVGKLLWRHGELASLGTAQKLPCAEKTPRNEKVPSISELL